MPAPRPRPTHSTPGCPASTTHHPRPLHHHAARLPRLHRSVTLPGMSSVVAARPTMPPTMPPDARRKTCPTCVQPIRASTRLYTQNCPATAPQGMARQASGPQWLSMLSMETQSPGFFQLKRLQRKCHKTITCDTRAVNITNVNATNITTVKDFNPNDDQTQQCHDQFASSFGIRTPFTLP